MQFSMKTTSRRTFLKTAAAGLAGAAGCGRSYAKNPAVAPPRPDLQAPWTNALGMQFAPVRGAGVLFGIWDVRVQDYAPFVRATGQDWPKPPDFAQGPDHPAVSVSWEDAQKFCAWLTQQDRAAGLLSPQQAYRLPKDWEWSVAVGLQEPKRGTPQAKDGTISGVYPWDQGRGTWPPPHGAGNYAPTLHTDDFDHTSPVGRFAANAHGLFDMGGNVWQWCEDFYDGQAGDRALRGGSWGSDVARYLLSSCRISYPPAHRIVSVGFRVVLGPSA